MLNGEVQYVWITSRFENGEDRLVRGGISVLLTEQKWYSVKIRSYFELSLPCILHCTMRSDCIPPVPDGFFPRGLPS